MPAEGLQREARDNVLKCVAATAPKTQLIEHYNKWQDSIYLTDPGRRGVDGLVLLGSDAEPMTEVWRGWKQPASGLLGGAVRSAWRACCLPGRQHLRNIGRSHRLQLAGQPGRAVGQGSRGPAQLAGTGADFVIIECPRGAFSLPTVSDPQKELLKRLSTVDQYHVPSDGVWHPDKLLPRMAWKGCGVADVNTATGWSNPWVAVPASSVVEGFTEQLPSGAAALQWAMPLYGDGKTTAADRSSLPIARQDQQPRWISKPGFLAFGALRSYPLLQLRQLCVALRDRTLPLGHPAVRTLVRQALYHVGQLTGGEQPALLWRTEWGSGGSAHSDLLETLHDELHALAGEWLLPACGCHLAACLGLGRVWGQQAAPCLVVASSTPCNTPALPPVPAAPATIHASDCPGLAPLAHAMQRSCVSRSVRRAPCCCWERWPPSWLAGTRRCKPWPAASPPPLPAGQTAWRRRLQRRLPRNACSCEPSRLCCA